MSNTLSFVAVSNNNSSSKDNHNYALELRSRVIDAIVATLKGEELGDKPQLTSWGKAEVKSLLKGFETKAKFALQSKSNTEVCNSIELAWGIVAKDKSPKEIVLDRSKSTAHSERFVLQTLEEKLGVPQELWYKPHKDLTERV